MVRLTVLALLGAALAAGQQQPAQPAGGEWISLFDGKSLEGWKETPFVGRGKVAVKDGAIILGTGYMTGVNLAKPFPKLNYELRFEAARLEGNDFFAALTFPIGPDYCSWINGGWGGGVVGLSSVNTQDASENETTFFKEFQRGTYYRFRLQVTGARIQGWIDDGLAIDVLTEGNSFSVRAGSDMELSAPIGFASYSTVSAIRKIEYRVLPEAK